jgi:hypothetical protein|tara:strand:+ start:2810 stop:2974 length:165 start_codon:yes stop_codon:yes gene_type:complete
MMAYEKLEYIGEVLQAVITQANSMDDHNQASPMLEQALAFAKEMHDEQIRMLKL